MIISQNMWQSLTEAQATVISGGLTLVAAVLGVLIGWWLLSGKVKDLESALQSSKEDVIKHRDEVRSILSEVQGNVRGLDQQFTSTLETLGQLRGAVGDIQSESSKGENGQDGKERLRGSWEVIRDRLESIAASPNIDGRRRAKYARIDRRQYNNLVDALDRDQALEGQGHLYRQALELWQSFRNGRRLVTEADCLAMEQFRSQLVPALA